VLWNDGTGRPAPEKEIDLCDPSPWVESKSKEKGVLESE